MKYFWFQYLASILEELKYHVIYALKNIEVTIDGAQWQSRAASAILAQS